MQSTSGDNRPPRTERVFQTFMCSPHLWMRARGGRLWEGGLTMERKDEEGCASINWLDRSHASLPKKHER